MKTIHLSNFDQPCIVDDDAPGEVFDAIWFVKRSSPLAKPYVVTKSFGPRAVRIHRLITNVLPGLFVDHVNGDTLDNRGCNLRVCTSDENKRNRKTNCNSVTGFKGVKPTVRAYGCRYTAKIGVNGTYVYLGTFDTAVEAAIAYNRAAIRLHGEFARLNEIDEREPLRSAA